MLATKFMFIVPMLVAKKLMFTCGMFSIPMHLLGFVLLIGDVLDRPPVDTAMYILRADHDDDKALVTFTEHQDSKGVGKHLMTAHSRSHILYKESLHYWC